MSEERGTLESLARHLVASIEPLRRAFSDEAAFKALMLRLGWETAGLPPVYAETANAISEAVSAADALGDEPSPEQIAQLLEKASAAYDKITSIATAPPGVDAPAFLAEIGERLFELLLSDYLAAEQPALFNLLSILNVIEEEVVAATPQNRGHTRTRLNGRRFRKSFATRCLFRCECMDGARRSSSFRFSCSIWASCLRPSVFRFPSARRMSCWRTAITMKRIALRTTGGCSRCRFITSRSRTKIWKPLSL